PCLVGRCCCTALFFLTSHKENSFPLWDKVGRFTPHNEKFIQNNFGLGRRAARFSGRRRVLRHQTPRHRQRLEQRKQARSRADCVRSVCDRCGHVHDESSLCRAGEGLCYAQEMTRIAAFAVAVPLCGMSSRPSSSRKYRPRSDERSYGLPAERVLVASTGRIGVTMPMANGGRGILAVAKLLGNSSNHAAQAAEAIMTSDTRPKQIAVEFKLGGKTVRIGGICKGAGMIQPGMSTNGQRPAALSKGGLHATMLCFITTDAAIEAKVLQPALQEAVAQSFNRITGEGDMSTNDTVLMLANGLAGNKNIEHRTSNTELRIFQTALNHVCLELARMIVRDGEGVHRVVTVRNKTSFTAFVPRS